VNMPTPIGFEMLMNPSALLLLILVALLLAAELSARSPGVMLFPTGDRLSGIPGVRGRVSRHLPAVLRALGLALLVFALARPVRGLTPIKDERDVVDIMLCVDLSMSMTAKDFRENGELRDRLYVTKAAARDFIDSRRATPTSRFGSDRLGLIFFGAYAWTQCPLTIDYDILDRELERTYIDPRDKSKQATAIGSAIALAVSRLRNSEAKSKVIILLTDGSNNAGEILPLTAAELAKELDIRVYTIGAGTDEDVMIDTQTIFGTAPRPARLPPDDKTLMAIADATGAKFYRATDFEALKNAYQEISHLEKTNVKTLDFYEFKETFVPYACLGGLLVAASVFSRRLWFEPIP
jgi:Ca-activated chloride channel family protein